MAANGISDLPTKEARQRAKLELAASDRERVGNSRSIYEIEYLPTQYVGNDVVDNDNENGLIEGRPWLNELTDSQAELITEDGEFLVTEDGKELV